MTVEDTLQDIRGQVFSVIPSSINISEIEFEGALVVIYTKNPEKFAENSDIVRKLAKTLQKRIVVRPDPTVLADMDEASERIKRPSLRQRSP